MQYVLIGLIGILTAAILGFANAVYIAPALHSSKTQAEAVDYLNQAGQISEAIAHYQGDHGKAPVNGAQEPVDVLVSTRYMKSAPPGGQSGWIYDEGTNSLMTPAKGNLSDATQVCIAARKKAGIPNPEKVFQCSGADAPGGALADNDPCCLSN